MLHIEVQQNRLVQADRDETNFKAAAAGSQAGGLRVYSTLVQLRQAASALSHWLLETGTCRTALLQKIFKERICVETYIFRTPAQLCVLRCYIAVSTLQNLSV